MIKIYGIANCNTVRKAMNWLRKNDIAFEFHDYKKLAVDEIKLHEWIAQIGWQPLVNKIGTTWKSLDKEVQNTVTSEATAVKLMINKTSVIKRPLIEKNNLVAVLGFDEKKYKNIFY